MIKSVRRFFKGMLTIAWKDFSTVGLSPLFFLCLGLSCIFLSYVFPRELFQFASSYLMPQMLQGGQEKNIHFHVFVSHISYVNLLFLFCIPAFCMKMLAEEKKNRTFDLLMTTPISSWQICLGKYLALAGLLLCFVLITLLYPLMTAFWTEIPVGPLVSSYIGLFLLALLYAAVGLFASSLTSSLVLSVIMGIILNIALWFLSSGVDFSDQPIFVSFMEYLSLNEHLTNFIKGSLVVSSFVFFLSFISFFLFLVYKVIEFSRWRSA